jgi:hypothetical protein
MIKIMIVLASSLLLEAEAANVTATGGGIVKPGSNLVINFMKFYFILNLNYSFRTLKHDTFVKQWQK